MLDVPLRYVRGGCCKVSVKTLTLPRLSAGICSERKKRIFSAKACL